MAILRRAGATRLQVLHTRDRKVADSDEFVAPIEKAGGVWLGGGRQWRLVDAIWHEDTASPGRSARAGWRDWRIVGRRYDPEVSAVVRGDPSGNTIMLSPGHLEGFGFLKGSAIDQHVLVRNGRMI